MEYISFVDIENKKMYDLGKSWTAKYYLPYLAYKFQEKPIVLFGSETHEYLEDKYNLKEFGGKYEGAIIENENYNTIFLDEVIMSEAEFYEIYGKIGGKIITNLEDYIRYKYRPE